MKPVGPRAWLLIAVVVLLLAGETLLGARGPGPIPTTAPSPTAVEVASAPTAVLQPLPAATPTAEPTPSWRAVGASSLPHGTPESVGMDSRTLSRIDDLVNSQIDRGRFPGAVVLVARRGVVVKETAYGNAAVYAAENERLANPVPARTDTIYDLASLTKLYTATAALTLADRGRLDLDAPLVRYLPELDGQDKDKVTIRHLLTHTAGLKAGFHLWNFPGSPTDKLLAAYRVPLQSQPGESYLYSDCGPILVGKAIERISGLTLDRYVEEAVLRPLGLADTLYNPPADLRSRVAPTEVLPNGQRGVRWGQVHDGEARALDGVAGNAGMFATAKDVATFAQMWLDGGAYGGMRVLSSGVVSESLRPQLSFRRGQGLAWELGQSWYMGGLSSSSAFGHTGYTGTSLVVDPQRQIVLVFLANRVHPKDAGGINDTRTALANLVVEAAS